MNKKYTKILLSIMLASIILFPFYKYYNSKEQELKITAIGDKNTLSNGTEVWIKKISVGQIEQNLKEYIKINEWELKEDGIVSYDPNYQPTSFIIKYSNKMPAEISFRKHPYSGKVSIEKNGKVQEYDLFNQNEETFVYNTDNVSWLYFIGYIIVLYGVTFFFYQYMKKRRICGYGTEKLMKFIILGIPIIFRLYYFETLNLVNKFNDTEGYLNSEINILRTPGYPLYIKILREFLKEKYLYGVVIGQTIIALVSIWCIYKFFINVLCKKELAVIGTLVYGCLPTLVNYEVCILTDSFSVSFLIIFLYFLSEYLINENLKNIIMINLICFFLIMIRPSNLFLLIILFLFWFIRIFTEKKKIYNTVGLMCSTIIVICLFIYQYLVYVKCGLFSISYVGQLNQIITIIMNNWYIHPDYTEFSSYIQNLKEVQKLDDWTILNMFSEKFLYLNHNYEQVSNYIKDCIFYNYMEYKVYLKNIWINIANESINSIYATSKNIFSQFLFNSMNNLVFPFSFLQIFFLYLLSLIINIKYWICQKEIRWVNLGLSSFGLAYLIIGIFGAPIEMERHSICAVPIAIMTCTLFFQRILEYVEKNLNNNRGDYHE